jgi:hypothetical protein
MKRLFTIVALLAAWLVVAILDRVLGRRPLAFLAALAVIAAAVTIAVRACG